MAASAAQHRPRPVDVVDAPAPVPGPVRRPGVRRMKASARRAAGWLGSLAERAQELEAASGQVLRGRVEQGAVVGERDVVEDAADCCRRRTRPSRRPIPACRGTRRARGRSRAAGARGRGPRSGAERHQDHGRVVEVRVEVVVVLKRPAPRGHVRALGLPVARHRDLLVDHPLGRPAGARDDRRAAPTRRARWRRARCPRPATRRAGNAGTVAVSTPRASISLIWPRISG